MNCHMRKKVAPNTHHLDSDIQFLLMAFNWNWLVQVEYVSDKLVHFRKLQIICRKKDAYYNYFLSKDVMLYCYQLKFR